MTVDVRVLGPVRVLVDGRPIELGPARRRTLLAALTLEPGRVVPLDTLVERVWDGEPTANPAATLHAYVSRLRGALRTVGSDEDPAALLVTRSPGYLMDLPADAVDAHRFVEGLQQARSLQADGELVGASETVRAALDLWRGGRAYLDVEAAFARQEADRLTDLRGSANELAVTLDLGLGRHESVVDEAATLLRDDALREGLHAALILALYRSGRQAEALAHHGAVRELLADELGIDPGPELRRLHEQVLRQDAALDLAGPAVPSRTPRPAVVPATAVSGSGTRTHGRDLELARARDLLKAARDGRTSTLAVVGEAGIGKSRLVEDLAVAATLDGMRVAWGRCWQYEGAPVLWPWIQVVEAVAEQLDPVTLAEAVAGRAAAVATLVPQLARLAPTAPPATPTGQTDVVRVYDAVAALLDRAAEAGPLLVVLEDLHWADLASRELTEYVVAQLREAPLALAVTVRSSTDDAARGGSELLTALARHGRTQRMDLDGLSAEAVRDYVTDRTGSVMDPATTEALTERTGGNPFFVAELVRLLVTDVDGTVGAEIPETVPESVREVIARRIERLPEDDREVLRVAAVVGRTFDLDLIERVAGLDDDAVDEAVDRATALGIICSDPDPDTVGRHVFVHALTQQTLLDSTGPARLRRLHGRIAAVLLDGLDEEDAAALEAVSFHLTRAGGQPELHRAAEVGLVAADLARLRANVPEAEAVLLRTLQLCGRLTGADAGQLEMAARVRLWSLYAATEGPGGPREVGQHEEAMRLIARHGGPLDVAAGHQAQLAYRTWVDDLAGIDRLVEEMAAAAEAADDDVMRMAARIARGQGLTHRGRLSEALDEFRSAAVVVDSGVKVPGSTFPLEPRCVVPFWTFILGSLLGDRETADEAWGLVASRHRATDPVTEAYVDINLAWATALRDEPERCLLHATRGEEAARALGLEESLKFTDILAPWARERVEPGSGLEDALEGLARTRSMPTLALRPMLRALLADVLARAGRHEEALQMASQGLAESEATGDRLGISELHRHRAAALTATGAASQEVRQALRAARRIAEEQRAQLLLSRVTEDLATQGRA